VPSLEWNLAPPSPNDPRRIVGRRRTFAAQIAELDAYIENLLRPEQEIIDRLDDTPGINRPIAEIVIAEAGTDMNRFSKPISLCFLDRPLSGAERKCRQTKKRPDSQR
jgi:hypothetical protein